MKFRRKRKRKEEKKEKKEKKEGKEGKKGKKGKKENGKERTEVSENFEILAPINTDQKQMKKKKLTFPLQHSFNLLLWFP